MRSSIFMAAAAGLLLAACGGGGGGSSSVAPTSTAPLTLASTTPTHNGNAGVDVTPTITFDGAPDASTITSKSITLSSSIGPVDSRLTISGNTITVTPVTPLAWGSHYQLAVTDIVRGAAGGKLSAASTINFDTRTAAWSTGASIGTSTVSSDAVVGIKARGAANGDVITVWPQPTADGWQLMAIRFIAATQNWGTPVTIQAGSKFNVEDYTLDVSENGNAVISWAEALGGLTYTIKAARFTATGGWSAPATLVDAGTFDSGSFTESHVSQNGNIIVTWKRGNGINFSINAVYFDAASQQWAPVRALYSGNLYADFPTSAINTNGTAMVAWSVMDAKTGVMRVQAARYDGVTKSWGAETLVEDSSATEMSYVSNVALDTNGNAIVLWNRYLDKGVPGTPGVSVARYNALTSSWGKPVSLSNSPAFFAQISVDAAGNILAAWPGYSESSGSVLKSYRYIASSNSWTALLDQANIEGEMFMRADAAGNSWLAWTDKGLVTVMRFNAATGKWDAPQVVASGASASSYPSVTVDQTGQAMVVWSNISKQLFYARLTGH